MRTLLVSLLLVVVTAVFGLGWVATKIYTSMEGNASQSDNISPYMQLGKSLALTVGANPEAGEALIGSWPVNSPLLLTITPINNLYLPKSLAAQFKSERVLVLEDEHEVSLHFHLPNAQHALTLSLPTSLVAPKSNSAGLALTIAFYLGIVVFILIWFYPLLRRLVLLQDTAEYFGSGQLSARIPMAKFSYIAPIELAYNAMAQRIQSLVSDNKLLSRAVSHNLKTPLARLRFGVDVMAEANTKEQRDKHHARINQDLDEMESLVNTLLQYAKLDEANIQLNKVPLLLNAALTELARSETANLTLTLDKQNPIIDGDIAYIKMAINNLLGNARQYCNDSIHITTRIVNEQVHLSIADDGIGIPAEDITHIKKPFVRGSNVGVNKGHGMGLAITTKIAEWHGAEVVVGNSKNLGGAEVTIIFDLSLGFKKDYVNVN